jgi:predicted membrane channel-forming protein YqfA (hemolysin III family)
MATPIVTDLGKLRDYDYDPIESSLYRQLIGSLMYLVNTRPNICFVVNMLSQFQVEPRQEIWVVAKHILRYLCGMIMYGLRYTSNSEVTLHGFTDSD